MSTSSHLLEHPRGSTQSSATRSVLSRKLRAFFADRSLFKGLCSIFDQCVVSGTSFVTSVVIGRSCTQQELGLYYLALSLILFARGIQADAVSAPYTIYCTRRQGQTLASYAGSSFAHQFALSLLTLAGLAGVIGVLSLGIGPVALAPTLWVLLGAVAFLLLREHIRSFTFAHLELGTAIVIDVSVAVLQLGGLLLLAYYQVLTVESVYLVMGIACAVACVGWFFAKRQPIRFEIAACLRDWQHNWSFAKWALASQFAGRITSYVMPWIIALMHGEAATGLLAACCTLVNLSGTFVTGVSNFLTPKSAHAFAQEGTRGLVRVLWKAAAIYTVTVGACCLALLVAGEQIAVWIYGGQYTGTGAILVVLALGTLANSLGITAGNGLWAIEKPRANFAADVWTLIVTLAAVLCLVAPWGVLGAALALLIGTVAGAAVRCFTLVRMLQAIPSTPVSGSADC